MTKGELIEVLEKNPVKNDQQIMVSIIRDTEDQYEMPMLVDIDYVGDQFINVNCGNCKLPSSTG